MSLSQLMRSDPSLARGIEDRQRLESRRDAKNERRKRMMDWEPEGGQPYVPRKVVIGYTQVQDGMGLWFAKAQSALYMTQSYLPFVTDSTHASSVAKIIHGKLESLEKEMRDEQARLDALITEGGYAVEKVFNSPMELDLKVFTPDANRFLNLALGFDHLIWQLGVLWIAGRIDNAHRVSIMNRWKKLLYGMVRELCLIQGRAKNAVRRRLDERRAEQERRRLAAEAGPEVAAEVIASAEAGAEAISEDAPAGLSDAEAATAAALVNFAEAVAAAEASSSAEQEEEEALPLVANA
jgi:uncharacterized protein YhhL (DUF1145 family)